MSQKGKVESGAELLARLGPRPSLHALGLAKVLGFEPSPGDIVELYGGEGVGKTELLLHLVSSAIVPTCTSDCCRDNKTEVIWVDCDLKFSVLRLAVLLEQHLMRKLNAQNSKPCQLLNSGNAESGVPCEPMGSENAVSAGNKPHGCISSENAQIGEPCDLVDRVSSPAGEPVEVGGKLESCVQGSDCHCMKDGSCTEKEKDRRLGIATPTNTQCDHQVGSASLKPSHLIEPSAVSCSASEETSTSARLSLKRKAGDMESDGFAPDCDNKNVDDVDKSDDVFKSSKPNMDRMSMNSTETLEAEQLSCAEKSDRPEMSGEEMERRVEECLRCVHVLRCTSSQQLVCTLHSLQSIIAANRNIAVLVVDPISAFYWSDRCSDFQHASSFLHKSMSQVASVLKKIATSFGVRVMVSKQALVKSRTKEKAGSFISPSKGLAGPSREDNHVEFLGQVWGGVVTHRLVCSKSVSHQRGVRMTRYTLTGNTGQKQFTVNESGVHVHDP